MKSIKKIHTAVSSPIADLITYRALPTNSIAHIDPFLFLNHHGYQEYPKNNNGLPFGPHPHRGFETVTFILKGDLTHKDSGGFESVIRAGGVQWMTAGKGLIHAEVSSEEFKKNGGELEILQLWVNLPAKHKMTDPNYKGLQKEDIPQLNLDQGKVNIAVASGYWEDTKGPFVPLNDIQMATLNFTEGGKYSVEIPKERSIFFYVVKGKVNVNGQEAKMHHLVEFAKEEGKIKIEATEESVILLGHAAPFNEPIFAQGPFVMNSQEEIQQAFQDYQNGAFGTWRG
jgi:redox-sensitive bicupin YhaK (pirin superfamily)